MPKLFSWDFNESFLIVRNQEMKWSQVTFIITWDPDNFGGNNRMNGKCVKRLNISVRLLALMLDHIFN